MKNSKVPLEIVLFGTSTTGSVSPSIHRLKARRNQIAMALVAFVRFGRLDTACKSCDMICTEILDNVSTKSCFKKMKKRETTHKLTQEDPLHILFGIQNHRFMHEPLTVTVEKTRGWFS